MVSDLKKEKRKNKTSCLQISIQVVYSLVSLFALMELLSLLIQMYVLSTRQEIILKTGYLKIPEPRAAPGHGPVHQRAQDPDPPTSAQTLDPGRTGPCSQRPWHPVPPTSGQAPAEKTLGPRSVHQQGCSSLGNSLTHSGLTPAPGQLQPHSLLWQESAYPRAGQHQP